MSTEFIQDRDIYQRVLLEELPSAQDFLWIGTSDLKDLYMDKGRKMVPLLEILSDLVKKQVSIRLIHAKEPGKAFRTDFDRYPNLIEVYGQCESDGGGDGRQKRESAQF